MRAIMWILLSVSGANRIIAATVVPSNPGYSVLLGQHWMQSVSLHGDYRKGQYAITDDRRDIVAAPFSRFRSVSLLPQHDDGINEHHRKTHPTSIDYESSQWEISLKGRPFHGPNDGRPLDHATFRVSVPRM